MITTDGYARYEEEPMGRRQKVNLQGITLRFINTEGNEEELLDIDNLAKLYVRAMDELRYWEKVHPKAQEFDECTKQRGGDNAK